MCPKGDDPMTTEQNQRKLQLTISSSYSTGFTGSLGIEFLGIITYIDIVNPTSTNCKNSLETSSKFGEVTCQFTSITTNSIILMITFVDWPTFTTDNNFYVNKGQPSAADFYCDISKTNSGVQCLFNDVVTNDIKGKFY